MDKIAAREFGKQARLAIPPDQRAHKSGLIVARAQRELDWPTYRRLSIFLPMLGRGEVDTRPLLSWIHTTWDAIETRVEPVVVFAPDGKQFDVVFVPLLAVDKVGHRVGYGAGYYDQFLSSQKQALAIGLAYEDQCLPKALRVEGHDRALDMLITERALYRF